MSQWKEISCCANAGYDFFLISKSRLLYWPKQTQHIQKAIPRAIKLKLCAEVLLIKAYTGNYSKKNTHIKILSPSKATPHVRTNPTYNTYVYREPIVTSPTEIVLFDCPHHKLKSCDWQQPFNTLSTLVLHSAVPGQSAAVCLRVELQLLMEDVVLLPSLAGHRCCVLIRHLYTASIVLVNNNSW